MTEIVHLVLSGGPPTFERRRFINESPHPGPFDRYQNLYGSLIYMSDRGVISLRNWETGRVVEIPQYADHQSPVGL